MIVVRIWEGLGNQLFQYAYARALQLRTGEKVFLDNNRYMANILEGKRIYRPYMLDKFNIRLRTLDCDKKLYYFLERKEWLYNFLLFLSKKKYALMHFYREETVKYKEELNRLTGNYYMMGWFQNEGYFVDYREAILRDLKPQKKINISRKLKEILGKENTVSIHIRRRDFIKQRNVLPISYYKDAVQIMERLVEEPYYIVFSDDVEWAEERLEFIKKKMYIAQERLEDYEELLVMSCCKHNIIANSTFSWWGAWLNTNSNKIVIGPKRWFVRGGSGAINIMPNEWLRV